MVLVLVPLPIYIQKQINIIDIQSFCMHAHQIVRKLGMFVLLLVEENTNNRCYITGAQYKWRESTAQVSTVCVGAANDTMHIGTTQVINRFGLLGIMRCKCKRSPHV